MNETTPSVATAYLDASLRPSTQRVIPIISRHFIPATQLEIQRDWSAVFGRPAPLALEIGCGTGHFVLQLASGHPETDFLAIDIYNKGCLKTCSKLDAAGIANVRVLRIEARELLLNTLPDNGLTMDFGAVPEDLWDDTHLLYVCSPGNPTGKVMGLEAWRTVFDLAERHGFVIAADECYSEIYFDEAAPPLGALTAAKQLGRGLDRLVVFNSLSKRSNVPGLRSGFVAGDAELIRQFLLYRTYHGSAMIPAVQAASAAAWRDEAHVRDNRRQYREKFAAVMPLLRGALDFETPDAAFYLWARVPGGDDAAFARELFRQQHVTVLPGSYLAREARGVNPGRGFVRIALVDGLAPCIEAAGRIAAFARQIT